MADRNAALFFHDATRGRASWLSGGALRGGTLAELAAAGADAHVWLVDSRLLQLAEAELPEASRRVQTQALPFVFEDQLLTPLEELSFAAHRVSPTRFACAIFTTKVLEAALDELAAAGITVAQAIPDVLCVPWQESTWTLLFDGPDAWLRTGPYAGSRFARDQWPAFIGQSLTDVAGEQHVRVFGADPALLDALAAAMPVLAVDAQPPGRETLEYFADGYHQGLTIDLLQALPRRVQAGHGRAHRWWLATAALIASAAIGHAAFMGWHTAALSEQLASTQAQTLETFHVLFPQITRVEDVRVQAMQALAELDAQQAGGAPFLELLAAAAGALPGDAAPRFESVAYGDGALELRVGARDMAALERYQQALAGAGQPVQLMSVETRDDGAVGLLRIGERP